MNLYEATIVGIRRFTSRAGKPCLILCVTFEDKYTDGLNVSECWADPNMNFNLGDVVSGVYFNGKFNIINA